MTRQFKLVAGDVTRSQASGKFTFVTDRDKARQSMARLLGLDAPSGAGLNAFVGTVPDNQFSISADFQQNVRASFATLTKAQLSSQLAQRTDAERLSSIRQMYMVPANFGGSDSKTGYAFKVDVLTVAGEAISLGGIIAG